MIVIPGNTPEGTYGTLVIDIPGERIKYITGSFKEYTCEGNNARFIKDQKYGMLHFSNGAFASFIQHSRDDDPVTIYEKYHRD